MDIFKRFINDEKGSALIQTAIAIPILLGLFAGLVFFTVGFRYKLVVNMAAKEGARAYQTSGGNTQAAISKAYEELGIGRVKNANVTCVNGTVKIEKPYGFYVPMANKYLLNIKGEYTFMQEIEPRYYGHGW